MSVIGFDIGNESCAIAALRDGIFDTILNDDAKRETPTVVCFGDKQRFIGSAGAAFAPKYPNSTFSDLKSLLTLKDPIEFEYLSRKCSFTPTEMLAMIFSHLKQIAENNLRSSVADCVIGIPSYFHERQRRAYLNAAKIAGLKPLQLLHDCAAAALTYASNQKGLNFRRKIVAFVDIGHCGTQVSIAAFRCKQVKILSHSSDRSLGGKNFDEVIFRYFSNLFKENYKIDVSSDPKAAKRLRLECPKVKKVLSANTEAFVTIDFLSKDADVQGEIKRQRFDDLCSDLLRRIEDTCREAVRDASLKCVDAVELIGSGSRIPSISKAVASAFNKEPTRTLNSSECIARGCAMQCAYLKRNSMWRIFRRRKIKDSIPFSIHSSEGEIFRKNKPIPATKSLRIQGTRPLQLDILDEERSTINTITIDDSMTGNSNRLKAMIQLGLDINGIVKVLLAKREKDCKVLNFLCNVLWPIRCILQRLIRCLIPFYRRPNGYHMLITESDNGEMSEDDVSKAQSEHSILTATDERVGRVNERRNALESYVYDIRNKINKKYRSIMGDEERNMILMKLEETEEWIYEDGERDENAYISKLRELEGFLDRVLKPYEKED